MRLVFHRQRVGGGGSAQDGSIGKGRKWLVLEVSLS